jgi:hypothetical protein
MNIARNAAPLLQAGLFHERRSAQFTSPAEYNRDASAVDVRWSADKPNQRGFLNVFPAPQHNFDAR